MKTLVFGDSGATGKLVVSQLLERNLFAKIVVRETAIIPVKLAENKNIEILSESNRRMDLPSCKSHDHSPKPPIPMGLT